MKKFEKMDAFKLNNYGTAFFTSYILEFIIWILIFNNPTNKF